MTHAVKVLDRSKYLELALTAQRLVTGLVKARVEPESAEDLAAIAEDGLALFQNKANSYYALRTLRQAKSTAATPPDFVNVLQALMSNASQQTVEERGEDIDEIIRWFSLFQKQALGNYSAEFEPVPAGVLELCSPR